MAEPLYETHILLEPEQHQALTEIAAREGRSVSDIAREMIQQQLDQRQQAAPQPESDAVAERIDGIWQQYWREREQAATATREDRLAVLERIRQHREAILAENGGKPLDWDVVEELNQMRDERDAEIWAVLTGKSDT